MLLIPIDFENALYYNGVKGVYMGRNKLPIPEKKCTICEKSLIKRKNEPPYRFKKRSCCSRQCSSRLENHFHPSMEKHGMWNGGTTYYGGYIYRKSPGHPNLSKHGYVADHRLIMEKHLGRYLLKTEIVHHKNGVKDDNTLENLELIQNISMHMSEKHPCKSPYQAGTYKICPGCGEKIFRTEGNKKWWTKKKYCNRSCYFRSQPIWNKGRKIIKVL